MSYVLQCWSPPVAWRHPGSLPEVLAMLEQLDRQRGQEPRFLDFARRLTARYPCISTPESDDLDESELAWSDGPLDGRCDTAVYGIGLTSSRLDEVLPFVLDQARQLGLSVYDDQAGQAHLANGLVLDVEAGEQPRIFRTPRGQEAALPDKDTLLDRVETTLGPRLERLGFAIRRRNPRQRSDYGYAELEWALPTPIGWVRLLFVALDPRAGAVSLKLYLEALAEPVSRWRLQVFHGGAVPADAKPLVTAGMWTRRWMNDTAGLTGGTSGELVMQTPARVAEALELLDQQIGERLTPMLDAFRSLSALAAALYPGRLQFSPYFNGLPTAVDALVAAHLSGAPWTPALLAELEAQPVPEARQDKLAAAFLGARDQAFHAHTLACIEAIRRTSRSPSPPRPPLRWGRR